MKKHDIISALVRVARAAHHLGENTEDNGETITVTRDDFREFDRALDVLDTLADPPGEAATGPRKAEYWLSLSPEIGQPSVRTGLLQIAASLLHLGTAGMPDDFVESRATPRYIKQIIEDRDRATRDACRDFAHRLRVIIDRMPSE